MPFSDISEEQARRFSFFQLVHLLERFHRPGVRVGQSGASNDELIRFRPEASLAFPRSDVALLEPPNKDQVRYRMTVTFLGLYGTTSPLPSFYTEYVLRSENESGALREFLDVFHHRILSYFYRAGIKYRFLMQYQQRGSDVVSQRLLSFAGLGTPGLLEASQLPRIRLLRYLGLINQRPVSAFALRTIISDFFQNTPVEIEQCALRWVDTGNQQRNSLGRRGCTLSRDCFVGSRIPDRTSKFRITIGPIHYDTFIQFLPQEHFYRLLMRLVRFLMIDRLLFDIELIVFEPEIPPMAVSKTEPLRLGSRLGWTSWLRSQKTSSGSQLVRSLILPSRNVTGATA